MRVNYRQFKPADHETVAEFVKQLYAIDPHGKPMTEEKIKRTFEVLSKDPTRGTIIVIEHGDEIIGYAILINFWSNEFGGNIVNVDELYIKEEFRSQGIGTEFIKHVADTKFSNAVALQLEVTPDNDRAYKLYEKLGFKKHENDMLDLEL